MPTLGVVFPGQGSQAAGMGADAAAHASAASECFERASAVLGYDLLALVIEGDEARLRDTRISQPAIFTANVAIYRAVEAAGFTPIVSGGHSFGEFCSLTIAGAIGFDEAVALVHERGLAMGEAADASPGAMAAVIGFDQAMVEKLCAEARAVSGARVDVANLNAPIQIVVSGDVAGVDELCELAKANGAKRVVMLNVSGAWHSDLMEPAMRRFATHIEKAPFTLPAFDVIGNVEVEPYRRVEDIRRCLIASLCARVRWHETAVAIAARKPDFLVECGATPVLAPMLKRIDGVSADRVFHVADRAGVERLILAGERLAV
jgi:[acyl-carrier-protein] S-malonyltransferase